MKNNDYEPNLIAQTLKNNRIYHVAAIIPDPEKEIYWNRPKNAILKAAEDFKSMGLSVHLQKFDSNSVDSFKQATEKVLKLNTDAIFLSPQFLKESLEFFNICQEKDVPFITFNAHIDQAKPICHIGQDLRQSGRLAANLIHLSQPREGKVLIVHVDENPTNSVYLLEKEEGFLSYFKDQGYPCHLIEKIRIPDESPYLINQTLKDSPDEYVGVYITTSKSSKIIELIKKGAPSSTIVGYDLIEENVKHLKNNEITFLINQSPFKMAYQGIVYLVDHLIFKKDIPSVNLLPLDVITKENVDSYLGQLTSVNIR